MKNIQIKIKSFCLVALSLCLLSTNVMANTLEIGIIFPDVPDVNNYQEAIQMAIHEHNGTNHTIKIAFPTWRTVSKCNEMTGIIEGLVKLKIRVIMGIGIELTDNNGCLPSIEDIVTKNKILYLVPTSNVAKFKPHISSMWMEFFTPVTPYELKNFVLEYKNKHNNKDAGEITIQSYKATKMLIEVAKLSNDLSPEKLKEKFVATKEISRLRQKYTIKQITAMFCGVKEDLLLEVQTIVASVRKEPRKDAEIVGVLNKTDMVIKQQSEQKGNWIHIKSQSKPEITGWIHNMLIE